MRNEIIRYLKSKLKPAQFRRLRNFVNDLRACGQGANLDRLGEIYGTDKYGIHFYTQHYKKHFESLKFKRIKLLEIGVGGYDAPDIGANSLRMWKKYFPQGKIYSIDIYDKSLLQERRIKIYKGSQVDVDFLTQTIQEIGELDIIIDDGSHLNEHVIETFKILFPKLKSNGIYVVEDTQTAYWEDFGGTSIGLEEAKNLTNFFKNLTDGLNHKEFELDDYKANYFEQNIISIHFYHNLIFIHKGPNNESSNRLDDK